MQPLSLRARQEPFLDRGEERDLIGRAKAGDSGAMERVVLSHLNLAVTEARRLRLNADLLDDALQDAAEALMRAVTRFDPGRGTRFSTYARWSVREAVQAQLRDREIPMTVEPCIADRERELPFSLADLELLDDESRQIVLLRFGFLDGREHSERETAQLLGLTRHRVRVRECEAITRLQRRLANVGPRAPQGADPL